MNIDQRSQNSKVKSKNRDRYFFQGHTLTFAAFTSAHFTVSIELRIG